MAALVSAVPFSTDADVTMVGLATAEAGAADALLAWFPRAKLQSLERSEALRDQASAHLAGFGDRVRVVAVDVAALD